jgi:DNA-directed RNA polymerase specialized sigma24 family protein
MEEIKYLKALTFLQLQTMTGGAAYSKPELLLEKAGFTQKEIGEMLGKTQQAVAKAISRARAALKEKENE